MTYSFGIVGGGWYGCHIASSLLALGFHVELFEQHDRLFHEASGNNQFRLHQGFHYARHSGTRVQSRDGYARFTERYPSLSQEVVNNIYAVPASDSLIDYDTYRLIMASTGLHFKELDSNVAGLVGIAGSLQTSERVVKITQARDHFESTLSGVLRLGERVEGVSACDDFVEIAGKRFDFLIDASWGHFQKPSVPLYYEPTLLLYFEGPSDFPAITLVDGPLCSIYPTEISGLYTLSSVPHTPLGRYETSSEARSAWQAVGRSVVQSKRELMEAQISKYLPPFKDQFSFLGPQLSMKTKPIGAFDDRSCHVIRSGRCFSVLSGKIDTIFFAVERIIASIENDSDRNQTTITSSLRSDIEHFSIQRGWLS